MNNKSLPSVKLLIQSGIIPQNTLQQLANWKLLPEDSVQSIGSEPVTLENEWPTVEAFVTELGNALTEEMATIRQTEFDQIGHYEEVFLDFSDSSLNCTQDVFIDRLGRAILPARTKYTYLQSISFMSSNGSGRIVKSVIDKEPRYEGAKLALLVVYLSTEKEETDNARMV